jgi:hypothetical protein
MELLIKVFTLYCKLNHQREKAEVNKMNTAELNGLIIAFCIVVLPFFLYWLLVVNPDEEKRKNEEERKDT